MFRLLSAQLRFSRQLSVADELAIEPTASNSASRYEILREEFTIVFLRLYGRSDK